MINKAITISQIVVLFVVGGIITNTVLNAANNGTDKTILIIGLSVVGILDLIILIIRIAKS